MYICRKLHTSIVYGHRLIERMSVWENPSLVHSSAYISSSVLCFFVCIILLYISSHWNCEVYECSQHIDIRIIRFQQSTNIRPNRYTRNSNIVIRTHNVVFKHVHIVSYLSEWIHTGYVLCLLPFNVAQMNEYVKQSVSFASHTHTHRQSETHANHVKP